MTTKTTEKTGKLPETPKTAEPVKIQVSPKIAAARGVVDAVAAQARKYIESGELIMPKDFDVNGALKGAWLTLQEVKDKDGKPALEVCSQNSIANALLDMIVQGLNSRKRQCAFVVFGTTLVCMREYFGSMAIAERVNPSIKDWGHDVIYEGDEFEYETVNGKKVNITHKQSLANIQKDKIVGAYAQALDKDGKPIATEIMTWEQLLQAWKQSPSKPFDDNGKLKPNSTHAKFQADMARRTVINKVAKFIINRSSDNQLLLDRINRNQELADAAIVQDEINTSANIGPELIIEAGHPQIEGPGKELEEDTAISFVECPDGGKVAKSDCELCSKKEGCSVYTTPTDKTSPAEKKNGGEKGPKEQKKMPGF